MDKNTEIVISTEELRSIIQEEVRKAIIETKEIKPLPVVLTITELMEVLKIGRTKASELVGRSDFPVCREGGIRIPSAELLLWIKEHTEWKRPEL